MHIIRLLMRAAWLMLLLLALAACGGSTETSSDGLPLAEDQPTLLFFFTDN